MQEIRQTGEVKARAEAREVRAKSEERTGIEARTGEKAGVKGR